MADMIEEGLDYLADEQKEHVTRNVSYSRGGDSVTVAATVGRTRMRISDAYGGTRLFWTDRDFLIDAADIVLAGEAIIPKRGDRIEEAVDGVVVTFEVGAPDGEHHWRWSDAYHRRMRIHTNRIKAES